jgi:hypothetical protein
MRRQQLRADEALWRAVEEMAAGVKKLPRDLLVRLKELLVLDWRKKSGARLQLKLAIEEALDTGLPPRRHARAVPPEMLGRVRARIRELSETPGGRVRGRRVSLKYGSGRDLDVLDAAGRRRDRHAVLPQPFEVKLDGLADLQFDFLDRFAGSDAAGQVGHIGGVVAFGLLDHDGVAHLTLTSSDPPA